MNPMRGTLWLGRFGMALGLLMGLVLPSVGLCQNEVLGVRHWSSPTCTRVVLDLSQEIPFREVSSSGQKELVVEFPGNLRGRQNILKRFQDALVDEARVRQPRHGVVELVLKKRDSAFKHTVFLLPRVNGRPVRLIVDVENPKAGQVVREQRRAVQADKGGKAKVVVIDPGHGGEDPGAIGHGGTREKDVVLSIARVLEAKLNGSGRIRAFLTRTGDYFVALGQRVQIAKEYGADLFLSIHADSSPNRSTKGASVYCLSLTGATDEAARILADKENSSDLIGGVRLSGDHDLNVILVDMVQTQTINESLKLGEVLLECLQPFHEIRFPAPRQAGFRVLKAPDVPSVLVEVGFLSNPDEEARLKDSAFQRRLTQGLERAVLRYLGEEVPAGLATASAAKPKPQGVYHGSKVSPGREHVVQPGQSLSQIASRYRTTVERLKALNGIQDPSLIRPGQRIVVP